MPAAAWPQAPAPLRPARRHRFADAGTRPGRGTRADESVSELALTIRRARPSDRAALARLAGLDSARPLAGDVLVALVEEQPVAALELSGSREVADPFRPSEEARAVLRVRAEQLRSTAGAARRGRRHRFAAATRSVVR